MKARWLQGLVFFAIFIVILALANLPLDAIGHTASLRYGISVQGWASWFGDQGKGLAVSLVIGVPIAALLQLDRPQFAAPLLVLALADLAAADLGLGVYLARSSSTPSSTNSSRSRRTMPPWSDKLEERSWRAPAPTSRPTACS